MQPYRRKAFLAALLATAGSAGAAALAQTECSYRNWEGCLGKPWVEGDKMETPIGSAWWPNPLWGGEDEAGSTNWYTKPEVLARALSASTGKKVYRLGHVYSPGMPFFGARSYQMRIPGTPTIGSSGSNGFVYNDDYVAGGLGQVGTQFDGLAHADVQFGAPGELARTRFYNGFTSADMWDGGKGSYGLQKLGIEKLHPIVARGILLDVAAAKGGPLPDGYKITMDDIRETLAAQDMAEFEFLPGDALMFRTGWVTPLDRSGGLWRAFAGHRHGSRALGRRGSAGRRDRRRQPRHRALPGGRSGLFRLRAFLPADPARHRRAGKHEALGTGGGRHLCLHLHFQPGAVLRRDRLAGRAHRDQVDHAPGRS